MTDARQARDAASDANHSDVLWKEGTCVHPLVERDCRNGWCAIPPGCFVYGSPEGEFARGLTNEEWTHITLTHSFWIQQFELTQREWTDFGLPNPGGTFAPDEGGGGDGSDPQCPVGNVSWVEAATFANLLSARHSPPLSPCYSFTGCTGAMGNSLACSVVALTVASVYECTGFRLPTAGEWEYAARAGTRTTFYSGNYAPGSTYGTTVNGDEPMLDSVAWYHVTSKNFSQPVGQKLSNGWGLYDVLGNAFEWVFDEQRAQGYGAQQVADPGGELVQVTARQVRGGGANCNPENLRVASEYGLPSWNDRGPLGGFRLALTGTTNPGSILGMSGVADASAPPASLPHPTAVPSSGPAPTACTSRYQVTNKGGDSCDYSGSGLVKDSKTGLTWTRQEYAFHMGQSQPEASSHCQSLGMRLPTKDEALAIAGSSFDSCSFPCTWGTYTSTSAGSNVVWHVNYDGSSTTVSAKEEAGGFVMCVK